jgi:5-bromo-4-chloroindolyl phosphate hydrolysis protein
MKRQFAFAATFIWKNLGAAFVLLGSIFFILALPVLLYKYMKNG